MKTIKVKWSKIWRNLKYSDSHKIVHYLSYNPKSLTIDIAKNVGLTREKTLMHLYTLRGIAVTTLENVNKRTYAWSTSYVGEYLDLFDEELFSRMNGMEIITEKQRRLMAIHYLEEERRQKKMIRPT